MSILDRYIARQYLLNCLILLVVLCTMVVMVDMFLHLDRFTSKVVELQAMDMGVPREQVHLSALETTTGVVRLAVGFYGPQLLRLFAFLLGTVLMAAMGFTFSQMARKREMTAVLASGVSLPRLAVPVLLVAVGLNVVQLVVQETVIPRYKYLIARSHGEIGEANLDAFRVPFTPDGEGRLLEARRFNEGSNTLEKLVVIERNDEHIMKALITAPFATWDGQAWVLQDGIREEMALDSSESIKPEVKVKRLATDLDPATLLLRKHQALRSMLSWREVSRILHKSRVLDDAMRAELQRIRWSRPVSAVNNLLMLAALIPFFLVREPKNMALQAAKAVPVGLVIGIISLIGVMMNTDPIPPQWGVWLSSAILLPIALASWSMIRT
ncbi:MAG TPA: YjgP/YjgQ family permease [Phycisphaeraceae bacterium]|nr:YjgP/YjgQ family permease [Phycisphaeraceae bacterium]